MADPPEQGRSFFEELKRRRVVRVAIGYGAAAFVVLQAADIIFPALGIPEWGFRALVIATLAGFPIALALAWAFQLTPEGLRRTGRDEGEGPVIAKVGGRQVAWLGIATVFVAVLAVVWLRPPDVSGSVAPEAEVIAVVPFSISGSADAGLGEGLVDLISRNLDEVEGLRVVDPRMVLHHWSRLADAGPVTADVERELGRTVSAASILTGSLVQLGSEVVIDAELTSIGGTELASVSLEGGADDLLALVDRLSIELLREVWRATSAVPTPALGEVTTENVDAMRFFLDGERRYRASDWAGALESYASAIASDGQFAFAYYRMTRTLGWLGTTRSGEQSTYIDLALTFGDQLPERIRRLAIAERLWLDGEREASVDTLRLMSDEYPDDPEVWLRYADNEYHLLHEGAGPTADPVETQLAGFDRALALDPSFLPAVAHPLEVAFRFGDAGRVDRYADIVGAAAARDTAAIEILNAARGFIRDPGDASSVRATFDAIVPIAPEAEGLVQQVVQAVTPALLRSAAVLDSTGQRTVLARLSALAAGSDEAAAEARRHRAVLLASTGRLREAAEVVEGARAAGGAATAGPAGNTGAAGALGAPGAVRAPGAVGGTGVVEAVGGPGQAMSAETARAIRRDAVYAGFVDASWLTAGAVEPTTLVLAAGRVTDALWAGDAGALRAAVDAARGLASASNPDDGEERIALEELAEAGEGFLDALEGNPVAGLDRVHAVLRRRSFQAGSFREPLWFLWLDTLPGTDAGRDRALDLLERPWPGSPAFEIRRLAVLASVLAASGRSDEAAVYETRVAAALAGADPGLDLVTRVAGTR